MSELVFAALLPITAAMFFGIGWCWGELKVTEDAAASRSASPSSSGDEP